MKWKEARETIAWAIVVLGGLFGFYRWATAPSVKLTAIVEYDSFIWPAGFASDLQSLRNALDEDSLKSVINSNKRYAESLKNQDMKDAVSQALDVVAENTRSRFSLDGMPRSYKHILGYWYMTLENGKNQELESVEVFFPSAVLVQIKREGMEATRDSVNEIVRLGRMRPGETVSLVAWTDTEPTDYKAERIRVTHSGGVGDVKVLQRVGPTGQFFDRYLVVIVWCLVWLLFLFFMVKAGDSLITKIILFFRKMKRDDKVDTGRE